MMVQPQLDMNKINCVVHYVPERKAHCISNFLLHPIPHCLPLPCYSFPVQGDELRRKMSAYENPNENVACL